MIIIAIILVLSLIGLSIEKKYSPRFGYTRENWIVLWFGLPSNRKYIRIW